MASPSSPPAVGPLVRRVDGPMLPHLNRATTTTASSLVPILTPPLPSSSVGGGGGGGGGGSSRRGHDDNEDDDRDGRRYLLVPSAERIVVRSARRGRRICELAPGGGEGTTIRAVALARVPRSGRADELGEGEDENDDDDEEGSRVDGDDDAGGEWAIVAACSDGVLREWSLADLRPDPPLDSPRRSDGDGNDDDNRPRRSIRPSRGGMSEVGVIHMASCASSAEGDGGGVGGMGAVLYALCDGEKEGSSKRSAWLAKFEIPPFAPSSARGDRGDDPIPLHMTPLASVKRVKSKRLTEEVAQGEHICLSKKDDIFSLLAAPSPGPGPKRGRGDRGIDYYDGGNDASAGGVDVFVVMVSSRGPIFYRDSVVILGDEGTAGDAPPPGGMVHFLELTRPTQYQGEEELSFVSAAMSPDVRDLALGRADGRIEVLDGVFDNIASYLDLPRDGEAAGEEGGEGGAAAARHPETVTVRRTVHWHAHPVRALAFFQSDPASLLSGGEESVLVTWQLERNAHRPSDFISRVGQGGIVHVLCCRVSNRVFVFCIDNSVQCFDAANSEREWCERGLASMALHEEEERGVGRVLMVTDPITGLPMLANLPGAPGTVHWYDPKSASVVGTLEVAPHNRVSRRDPSDPHVPAPAVTHLAVGKDGRDMVTVDVAWTENTSIGAPRVLSGPNGDRVAMNVCTSVKFWAHVNSPTRGGTPAKRRRGRIGDVPMDYELVSSMASPHGREGAVCALAVARGGNVACTLSGEEDAFRVWVKNAVAPPSGSGAGTSTLWKCLYRVKTPSGYSNLLSRGVPSDYLARRPVAFSSDGSVLSVAYGPCVTLWDHSDATLLTSVTLDGDAEDIGSVDFLTEDDDSMLLASAGQIGIKSPFGGARSRYLGDDEWSIDVGSSSGQGAVTAVAPLCNFGCGGGALGGFFAVALALDGGLRSVVSVVGGDGSVVRAEGTDAPIVWRINGDVRSLYVDRCAGSFVRLLAITGDCQMLSLSCGPDGRGKGGTRAVMPEVRSTRDARAHAPVLKVGSEAAGTRRPIKRRKVSIGALGGSPPSSSEFDFPSLSGKFTTAFIARSLGKGGS